MSKKMLLFLLLMFITLIPTGCDKEPVKNNENLPANSNKPIENIKEEPIEKVHKEFNIKNVTDLLSNNKNKFFSPFFMLKDNCYGINGQKGNEIIKIDKLNNKSTILNPSNAMGIVNFKLYDNFIIWIEVDNKYFETSEPGLKWNLNIMDINTKEKFRIESSKDIKGDELGKYHKTYYYFPSDINVSHGKIVYSIFDLDDNNEIYQAVKYYDISTKSKKVIDSRKKVDGFFSAPSIESNKIVYSYAIFRKDSVLTDSKVYVYDLTHNGIIELPGTQYINPKISGDFILAQERNNGDVNKGNVSVYDLKTNAWREIYNCKISEAPMDMENNFCIDKTAIVNNLAFITSNISSNIICYDFINKSYSIVDSVEPSERNNIAIISSNNNSIIWITNITDKSGKPQFTFKSIEF